MQRLALIAIALCPAVLPGQRFAGTELWRVAAQTLTVPAALASDGAAAMWNPAQRPAARVTLALEAVQGANDVGASGVLAEARVRAGRLGSFAVVYGRMAVEELVRTSQSPTPDPGSIPYFTQLFGVNWARAVGPLTVGATATAHATTLDQTDGSRLTTDLGVRSPMSDRVRLGVATHFADRLATDDPAQEMFAGVEVVAWRSRATAPSPRTELRLRYGTAFAHGYHVDHQIGMGVAVDSVLTADVLLARDGGWAGASWRPVVGVGLSVGKYRVGVAGDGGASGLGTTFRVAFEARIP